MRHQIQFLMDHADPALQRFARVGEINFPVLKQDLSLVFSVDPAENLHQRGLSRAVFADQPVYLAPRQRQPAVIQGKYARKPLCDVFHP